MSMVKKKSKTTKLTARELLGALSYWGTFTRFLLVSVLVGFAFILNIFGGSSGAHVDIEVYFLIYGLATLLIFDLGYVTASRALSFGGSVDRWVVYVGDALLAVLFVAPSLISIHGSVRLRAISFIAVLFVLSVRILLGLLFAKKK